MLLLLLLLVVGGCLVRLYHVNHSRLLGLLMLLLLLQMLKLWVLEIGMVWWEERRRG